MRSKLLLAVLFFALIQLNAQSDRVLFTVAGEKVTVGEFEYVYTKNNINNQSDYSEKSLRDYLKLYENFRLKVKEAEARKLDTISSLQKELDGYRKQLAKSYLYDKEISDKLINEAYQRSTVNLNVSHILVRCEENALPQDSMDAYKKIIEIRKRIMKGESFEKVAKAVSEDPSAKENGGNIGWISAFGTVYPFESAAYNLKKGEVSGPVRTNFGYHILKLIDERADPGEFTVSHIMMKFPDSATAVNKALVGKRLDSVYTLISTGKMSYDTAVVSFSEDRTSKFKGGVLAPFGSGRMVPEFENAAFLLTKDGEISKPIMSPFGWHIIKRISVKKQGTFEETRNEIKKKVERDSRSQVAKTILIANIKREYNFAEFPSALSSFISKIDSGITAGNWKAENKNAFTEVLFSLAGKNYTGAELASFIEKNSRKRPDKNKSDLVNEFYETWKTQSLMDYEETQLDRKKPDFRNLMKEYRDGVLIFELTDREVWGKAVKDTVGLQNFHEQNKTKYMWGKRIDCSIFNCTDLKIAEAAHKMALKNKSGDEIRQKLNKEGSLSKVSIITGKYEKGQYDVVDKIEWKAGTTAVEKLNDSSFRFVQVHRIAEPEPKLLKEAKGYIVSDYQEYLEKTWLASLREKYPLKVNEDVLKSLIKK